MNQQRRKCSVCGATLRQERITYTQTIGEALYIVTDVPADVCPRDGEQYLTPDTVDALQGIIDQGKEPRKTIEVPVYHFSQAMA